MTLQYSDKEFDEWWERISDSPGERYAIRRLIEDNPTEYERLRQEYVESEPEEQQYTPEEKLAQFELFMENKWKYSIYTPTDEERR